MRVPERPTLLKHIIWEIWIEFGKFIWNIFSKWSKKRRREERFTHLVAAGLSTDVELHRLGGRSKLVGDASTFALLHYFQLSAFLPFEANSWPMFVSSVVSICQLHVREND